MGKQIYVQRRGRGFSKFKATSHKRTAPARYLPTTPQEREDKIEFTVVDLIHETGRGTPLMKITYQTGETTYLPAVEGVYVGFKGEQGPGAALKVGNILPLSAIPESMWICNIEMRPGDGGNLARASGASVSLVSKDSRSAIINLPSGKVKRLKHESRAMIGAIASGGRKLKPFLKAGKKRAWKYSRGHTYPVVRGVAMNAVSHPHGGGAHQSPHKPTTISRNAPPGRKVGLIAARRTGPGGRKRKDKTIS